MKKQFNFYMQDDTLECFDIIRSHYSELSGLSNSQIAEFCIRCVCNNYHIDAYNRILERYKEN